MLLLPALGLLAACAGTPPVAEVRAQIGAGMPDGTYYVQYLDPDERVLRTQRLRPGQTRSASIPGHVQEVAVFPPVDPSATTDRRVPCRGGTGAEHLTVKWNKRAGCQIS